VNLLYYLYPTLYETKNQKAEAEGQLQREWEGEKGEVERFNLTPRGIADPQAPPELKERGKDRKGEIDWFIYHECIQLPLLYYFALAAAAVERPGIVIMEDNAPTHIHHYHTIPRQKLGIQRLVWPANSLDLNPIKTIWMKMKDQVKEWLGIRMTASGIWRIVESECQNYPVERINRYIFSMPGRMEACIADGGGNYFNF